MPQAQSDPEPISDTQPVAPPQQGGPQALADGTRVGEFEIVRRLGTGGMAAVYLARHRVSGRTCALKVAATHHVEARLRFEREAVAQATACGHPNVAQFLGTWTAGLFSFLAIEYLPGGSLEDKLRRGGPLEPAEAARTVAALARGLAATHALGILHRDLKPANVMFSGDGTPKLVDFGVAHVAGSALTQTGQLLGTPQYMAPEQANGERTTDERTDVYGLGAVLYACLTGEPPFRAQVLVKILHQVMQTAPDKPSSHAPVPAALDAIVLRAMAKSPDDRQQGALALADALEAFARSAAPRPARWPAALALAGVAACGLAWLATEAPHPAATAAPVPAVFLPTVPPLRTVAGADKTQPPDLLPDGVTKRGREFVSERDGSILVWVSPGRFRMGNADAGWGPERNVELSQGFFLGKHEVSWAQYSTFSRAAGIPLNEGRHLRAKHARPDGSVVETDSAGVLEFGDYPAVFVHWQQAHEYCQWAGGRLPTEAEWEYAARGEVGSLFPWGDDSSVVDEVANLGGTLGGSKPVDSFPGGAAECGALNMSGNVREWVEDVALPYDELLDLGLGSIDPRLTYERFVALRQARGGLEASDYFQRGRCVVRGGSYEQSVTAARTYARDFATAEDNAPATGFRIVIPVGS
ncbi:bifunctional serine/threonine-protein kinase/formylglycine-generating enzyme family protein [Planctomycetota bacterium]|nr:bifunctional serine/threonine-protein kinase/formylglycine-generating enzyme family protein [Planctomycetota bacterium]